MAISKEMITTAFELPGYTIVSSQGVVRGISVRSLNVFSNIAASWRTIFGGDNARFAQLCEETRQNAFSAMIKQAQDVGANAIVGVRYDANEIGGVAEVLAYGTAISVQKIT